MKTSPSPGDVIGFCSCTRLGVAINLGTWGIPGIGLSHVGIVGPDPRGNLRAKPEPLLYESTTVYDRPCLIQGRAIDGVQAHHLGRRVTTYRGKVWWYPLADPAGWPPTPATIRLLLLRFLRKTIGTPYDQLGAFRSRDLPIGRLHRLLFGREDLVSLFCSEFVAAALRALGVFETENASAWNPNSLIRALRRQDVVQKPVLLSHREPTPKRRRPNR